MILGSLARHTQNIGDNKVMSEYALLQRKYARENLLNEVSSHRSRARGRGRYVLAAQRNGLEVQRENLRYGLEKLPVGIRRHYLDRISEVTGRIDASKRRFPQYRGDFD